jgi:DNA invertase Pin-like site-specific DNA recombinase
MNGMLKPPGSLLPGTKVFAYIRDSGGTDQDLSISRQIREITRWANHYQITITQFYADEARSGRTTKKREQLANLMERLRSGEVEERGVIVWSYDRFARNAIQSQHYRSEIRSLGFIFHSLTDYIPEGSEAVIFEAFKDYVAEQFSEKLSVNVKSGSRAVLEKYKVIGGFPPRGFMRERVEMGIHRNGKPRIGYKWIPDPDLIPTVRLAFEMRARGATVEQIIQATHLYEGVNSYTTFFTNRLYMGVFEYGDLIIPDYCEPIVTAELWNQVQELGRTRAHITKENNPRRISSLFLFSGLIFCQHCGAPMSGHVVSKKDRPRREYYSCSRRSRRLDCPAREVPARAIETAILAKLEDLALDLERLIQFQTRVQKHYKLMGDQTEGQRVKLRRELRDAERHITNLTNAIAERGHSKALLDSLHKAELQGATLRIQLEEMERGIHPPEELDPITLKALAEEVKDALHSDDLHKKKLAIHMLTSRVIVSREDAQVHGVLYYIPTVCVGKGTPAGVRTEDIQFYIEIPKYTKVTR